MLARIGTQRITGNARSLPVMPRFRSLDPLLFRDLGSLRADYTDVGAAGLDPSRRVKDLHYRAGTGPYVNADMLYQYDVWNRLVQVNRAVYVGTFAATPQPFTPIA